MQRRREAHQETHAEVIEPDRQDRNSVTYLGNASELSPALVLTSANVWMNE